MTVMTRLEGLGGCGLTGASDGVSTCASEGGGALEGVLGAMRTASDLGAAAPPPAAASIRSFRNHRIRIAMMWMSKESSTATARLRRTLISRNASARVQDFHGSGGGSTSTVGGGNGSITAKRVVCEATRPATASILGGTQVATHCPKTSRQVV